MTEEEIIIARKKYEKLLSEKETLEKIKNKIKELEKNEMVREYIGLVSFVNADNREYDSDTMIFESFNVISKNTSSSNQILVYMGSYENKVFTADIMVPENIADYIIYIDLETEKIYSIKPTEKEKFENNKNIIYMNIKNQNIKEYQKKYKSLKKYFFENLLEKSQSEVVKELVKDK